MILVFRNLGIRTERGLEARLTFLYLFLIRGRAEMLAYVFAGDLDAGSRRGFS